MDVDVRVGGNVVFPIDVGIAQLSEYSMKSAGTFADNRSSDDLRSGFALVYVRLPSVAGVGGNRQGASEARSLRNLLDPGRSPDPASQRCVQVWSVGRLPEEYMFPTKGQNSDVDENRVHCTIDGVMCLDPVSPLTPVEKKAFRTKGTVVVETGVRFFFHVEFPAHRRKRPPLSRIPNIYWFTVAHAHVRGGGYRSKRGWSRS